MSRKLIAAILFVSITLISAGANAAGLEGRWLAEDIDGGGVIDRLQTTLEVNADGKVTGMGGCNRYAGSAKIDGDAIRFLPMGSTRMACSSAVMKQESKFHAALEKVRAWRIERTKLVLLDAGKFVIMSLRRWTSAAITSRRQRVDWLIPVRAANSQKKIPRPCHTSVRCLVLRGKAAGGWRGKSMTHKFLTGVTLIGTCQFQICRSAAAV